MIRLDKLGGGKLTIEAGALSWSDPSTSNEVEPMIANMQELISEILSRTSHDTASDHDKFAAEYKLRHNPYEGQVKAIVLIDINDIKARTIVLESVQGLVRRNDDNGDTLYYRRVGRLSLRKELPYPPKISPRECAAYTDCANGLASKTFVII